MRKACLPHLLPNMFSLNLNRPCALAVVCVSGLVCVMLNAATPVYPSFARESGASNATTAVLAEALGIRFVEDSTSFVIVERNGQEYIVDLATRTIRENNARPALAPTGAQQAPATPRPADTNLGIRVFQQLCSTCHGKDGKGLSRAGTPDFTDPQVQARLTDQVILNTIRNGKPGTEMPAWTGKLSEAEIRAVAS